MDFIEKNQINVFTNSGVESHQLLFPENSPSAKVTITKVNVPSGSVNPRHSHESSEQTWVALSGTATLLLEGEQTRPFNEGDVVRFAEGDTHGLRNSSQEVFTYMSVTSPPLNFRKAYDREWNQNEK